ncbi:HAMP domain-containing histidine kinase, partial [candidate division WWE3 bacterium]|nr:HAMP domain-containing histidine kinase [candidate division WWE3 bacterium]
FVSTAAHELRTPITTIRGYLRALKEDAGSKLNEDEMQYIERGDIASLQLITLMENLLSVSRIEKGTYTLNRTETDWVKIVDECVRTFQPQAEQHGITVLWDSRAYDIPKVYADPLRINEVLNNLVSNAINYTTKGKVTITLEHDTTTNMVVTHVTDTGQGIPKDALPNMFKKFFRVAGAIEQGSKGTGLGLYIARQIVELHRGTINVESTLGKGSTFSFSLPTVDNKQVVSEDHKIILNEHGGK